ncbi:MAG: homoserine O-succinyltransferase [Myxococcales bacterium]|nr:homoserine O-succinyltransferase [Myxococcales bacterium]MCB9642740.1 homoserine O-succinyltransferase [Myxococcales bacterium]
MLVLNENHPARAELQKQTAVIDPETAQHADIRALRLGVINLMPVMNETENDILRCISHSVLQIEPIWIRSATREQSGRHTSLEHVENFYQTLEEATREQGLDGLIVTGAPIERLDFEDVDYWDELRQVMDYAQRHVYCTMYLCWAAMAAAFHFYRIPKVMYPEKLTGLFRLKNVFEDDNPFTRGMNPEVAICQSRYTGLDYEAMKREIEQKHLLPLFDSDDRAEVLGGEPLGVTVFASSDLRAVYNLGHLEYHAATIDQEVQRDRQKALHYPVENYYLEAKARSGIPPMTWRADRSLFFSNFLNVAYEQMNMNPNKKHRSFVLLPSYEEAHAKYRAEDAGLPTRPPVPVNAF